MDEGVDVVAVAVAAEDEAEDWAADVDITAVIIADVTIMDIVMVLHTDRHRILTVLSLRMVWNWMIKSQWNR